MHASWQQEVFAAANRAKKYIGNYLKGVVEIINPGAEEVCDGIDNNCVGGVDEGFESERVVSWYADTDADADMDAYSNSHRYHHPE